MRIPQKEFGVRRWLLIQYLYSFSTPGRRPYILDGASAQRTHSQPSSIGMRVDRELSDAEDLQAAINVAWVLLCTALVFWEQARRRL